MSSTRQTLLASFGALALVALPLGCASEPAESSSSTAHAFGQPHGCGPVIPYACEQDEMCKLATGACGSPTAEGVCLAKPLLCPRIIAPVCGCDDKTYFNACEAMRAGMNIAYEGPCGPFLCGPPAGNACGPNQYCAAADCTSLGFCVDRPTSCDAVAVPVCGCDRKDYASACEAHAAGVTVLAFNRCPVVPWVPSAAPERRPPHSLNELDTPGEVEIPRPASF